MPPLHISSVEAGTPSSSSKFVWPCWWGGAAGSDKPPLIHTRIQELRREIGGLEARKSSGGPNFPVKSAKELEQKLQPALDKLGLSLSCVYDVGHVDLASVPATGNGKVVRSACWVKCTVRFCAEDGSYLESQGAGGGLDADDKAYGKATTYSRKDAILKMLAVPEKNMIDTDDESDTGDDPVKLDDEANTLLLSILGAKGKDDLQKLVPACKKAPAQYQPTLMAAYTRRLKELS